MWRVIFVVTGRDTTCRSSWIIECKERRRRNEIFFKTIQTRISSKGEVLSCSFSVNISFRLLLVQWHIYSTLQILSFSRWSWINDSACFRRWRQMRGRRRERDAPRSMQVLHNMISSLSLLDAEHYSAWHISLHIARWLSSTSSCRFDPNRAPWHGLLLFPTDLFDLFSIPNVDIRPSVVLWRERVDFEAIWR